MNIKELSIETVDEVIRTDYYISLFNQLLIDSDMTIDGIKNQEYSAETLIFFWHTFWENLPDIPSIRTPVFFTICDMAEHIFDDVDIDVDIDVDDVDIDFLDVDEFDNDSAPSF